MVLNDCIDNRINLAAGLSGIDGQRIQLSSEARVLSLLCGSIDFLAFSRLLGLKAAVSYLVTKLSNPHFNDLFYLV
jgi:hypothetical protein